MRFTHLRIATDGTGNPVQTSAVDRVTGTPVSRRVKRLRFDMAHGKLGKIELTTFGEPDPLSYEVTHKLEAVAHEFILVGRCLIPHATPTTRAEDAPTVSAAPGKLRHLKIVSDGVGRAVEFTDRDTGEPLNLSVKRLAFEASEDGGTGELTLVLNAIDHELRVVGRHAADGDGEEAA